MLDEQKILAVGKRRPGYLKALMESLSDEEKGEPLGANQRPQTFLFELGAFAREMRGEKKEPIRSKKIGRNEPCPCGSNRKYKKCCGK